MKKFKARHKERRLGELDEIILMAMLRLRDQAYGVSIRNEIRDRTGRDVSFGVMYSALEGLEAAGYVSSKLGEPTAERGGRAKRFYKIEGTGIQALHQKKLERQRLLEGVDFGLDPLGV